MSKYTIIGTLGPTDTFASSYSPTTGESVFPISLSETETTWEFGVSRALDDLLKLGIVPSMVGLELLNLAILVQIADSRINRVQTSQDAWRREIKIVLPVVNLQLWHDAKDIFQDTLNFLTGDLWQIDFRAHSKQYVFKSPEQSSSPFPVFDQLSLYSGGLDSTIGAIDLLETGHSPLFISYAGEGAVSSPQQDVFDAISEQYKSSQACHRLRFAAIRFSNLPGIGKENTTRGRSFLFFALATFAGSGFSSRFKLNIPENGLIALNVPLDSTRLGSLSTRTTHPYYIEKWNSIIAALGIAGDISNPYWNKTKGEMAAECKNPSFLTSIIAETVSCASPSSGRYTSNDKSHCGHCVPCIIRQAAINHAYGVGNDPTGYRNIDLYTHQLDSTKAEGIQIRAFQFAIERLNANPNLAKLFIYKQGPLSGQGNRIDELASVYLRGMKEVGSLLTNVQTYSSRY